METRANHVLIGLFTVLAILAGFGFAIWLAKVDFDRDWAIYDIVFDGPVSGLSTASPVRFNGITVGEVTSLQIEPDAPSKVRVRTRISADTPVRADSMARLELQGITGVQIVQITGGSLAAPPPPRPEGQPYPIIPSAKSAFDQLLSGAPDLLSAAIAVMNDVGNLVGQNNQQELNTILQNLRVVTGEFASRGDKIGRAIDSATTASAQMAQVMARLDSLAVKLESVASKADVIMDRDLPPLLVEARRSLQNIGTLARDMDMLVDQAGPGLVGFADTGLPQMNRFLMEARQLVATLDRVLQRVESDPARFLLGRTANEVSVPR